MALFVTAIIVMAMTAIPVYNLMEIPFMRLSKKRGRYIKTDIPVWKFAAILLIVAGIVAIVQAWAIF